jgi:hypothetical protein
VQQYYTGGWFNFIWWSELHPLAEEIKGYQEAYDHPLPMPLASNESTDAQSGTEQSANDQSATDTQSVTDLSAIDQTATDNEGFASKESSGNQANELSDNQLQVLEDEDSESHL